MPLVPSFRIKLEDQILQGLATVGKFDGKNPCLTCATSGGRIFVYDPYSRRDEQDTPKVRYLNINKKITAVASGRLDPNLGRDMLLVGTAADVLAYDVEEKVLGSSSHSVVKRAKRKSDGLAVAVKTVMRAHLDEDALVREIKIMRQQEQKRQTQNQAQQQQHHLPPTRLDRRYDLDVAPSMLNMNLKFNGAYMVASCVYNILACKFGYRHMLSVQMLFWEAIRRYYQTHRMDGTANYKLSLSSLLDVVQTTALCSERELSIYTDIAKQRQAQHGAAAADHSNNRTATPAHTSSNNTFTLPTHANKDELPFYRMQYYFVPKDATTLKHALANDHLVLANLTLFSNFLSARQGVVCPPNHTDQPAGMVVVTLVGYQEDDVWVVRFPFGLHWGDQGIGYVSFEYFDRYNRDRWIIDIDECSEPPEYRQQREAAQAEAQDTA